MPSLRTLLLTLGVSTGLSLAAPAPQVINTDPAVLPVVDLGYELYQATLLNETGFYYNFSNIRYAAPPVGNLRFAAPTKPAQNRGTIQNGTVGRICPQARPAWQLTAAQFIPAYLTGQSFNLSSASATSNVNTSNPAALAALLPPQDPRTSEDCLFLDVIVPRSSFQNAQRQGNRGAAVMVWIYGGGFTSGSKDTYPVGGLIERSDDTSAEEVIWVGINYRLGAFGFLAGPTFQASGGAANAGLLDQRLALQWVQDNIAKFGGDPQRVTVIGESAGGSSIMHQITAYAGLQGEAPFQQAIIQSPGFVPQTSNYQLETQFNSYLRLLNVTTLEQARQLPASAVIQANAIQVGLSTYGGFTYGPTVDGVFAPDLPGKLLAEGAFDTSLKVMVGHNADEGLLFTSPLAQNSSVITANLRTNFPDIQPSILSYITDVLYPPVFNGSYPYRDQISRAAFITSEGIFVCNTDYLNRAYGNQTYGYRFSVPPALHGQDIPYTYYNDGGISSTVLNPNVAIAMQQYFTSFAKDGVPMGGPGVPMFNLYGPDAGILNLNVTSIMQTRDDAANARCAWWQKALYE